MSVLTPQGRAWADAHPDDFIADVARTGYGSRWSAATVTAAIDACNGHGRLDAIMPVSAEPVLAGMAGVAACGEPGAVFLRHVESITTARAAAGVDPNLIWETASDLSEQSVADMPPEDVFSVFASLAAWNEDLDDSGGWHGTLEIAGRDALMQIAYRLAGALLHDVVPPPPERPAATPGGRTPHERLVAEYREAAEEAEADSELWAEWERSESDEERDRELIGAGERDGRQQALRQALEILGIPVPEAETS